MRREVAEIFRRHNSYGTICDHIEVIYIGSFLREQLNGCVMAIMKNTHRTITRMLQY